jgi:hypothetical protein
VRAEAELRGILGVVSGGTPLGADGSEVHVAVEVIGGEEAVGDVPDELGWEGGPVHHGRHGRFWIFFFFLFGSGKNECRTVYHVVRVK